MTRTLVVLSFVVCIAGCDGDGAPRPLSSPSGPPAIEADAVARHARQFEDDLPQRPAGSQQEFAAATYITAHLQQAGYVVELDPVPVEDLVRSSNVMALPPGGGRAEIVVTVGYDTGPRDLATSSSIGVFLELARALRVARPEHSVQFVALGAENSTIKGGALGSRRLVRVLQEDGLEPEIIQLLEVGEQPGVKGYGAAAVELDRIAGVEARTLELLTIDPDPFQAAEFPRTLVIGSMPAVGEVLLEYLRKAAH